MEETKIQVEGSSRTQAKMEKFSSNKRGLLHSHITLFLAKKHAYKGEEKEKILLG